jgi:hypothetical protein
MVAWYVESNVSYTRKEGARGQRGQGKKKGKKKTKKKQKKNSLSAAEKEKKCQLTKSGYNGGLSHALITQKYLHDIMSIQKKGKGKRKEKKKRAAPLLTSLYLWIWLCDMLTLRPVSLLCKNWELCRFARILEGRVRGRQ